MAPKARAAQVPSAIRGPKTLRACGSAHIVPPAMAAESQLPKTPAIQTNARREPWRHRRGLPTAALLAGSANQADAIGGFAGTLTMDADVHPGRRLAHCWMTSRAILSCVLMLRSAQAAR